MEFGNPTEALGPDFHACPANRKIADARLERSRYARYSRYESSVFHVCYE